MTIDDVAAAMRERFTESQGAPVTLTAEEWNVLAQVVAFCDGLETVLPTLGQRVEREARDLLVKARSGRGHLESP